MISILQIKWSFETVIRTGMCLIGFRKIGIELRQKSVGIANL